MREVHSRTAVSKSRPGRIYILRCAWCLGPKELHWKSGHSRLGHVFLRLSGEHSLCLVTMPLAFTILFVGVLYRNLFVHQVLPI